MISDNLLLKQNLEFLATIHDDIQQKRFLKTLIRNYVLLEKKVDALLKNTLPTSVAEEIKMTGRFETRAFDCTILFTDFAGFTFCAEQLSMTVLVKRLHAVFSEFDSIMAQFDGTKIKTIADAYMAVFGAPVVYENHAVSAVRAGFAMLEALRRLNKGTDHPFHMRIGIHSGRVMAGVVGEKRMQFDVFGDHVNTASRFEASGEIDRINVSETTRRLADNAFEFQSRGLVPLKNKQNMAAYFAVREKP
jgi:class 3 adenylate cyclase